MSTIDSLIAPSDIIHEVEQSGIKKAKMPVKKLFVLGILGGVYVAMSAQGSLAATYAIPNINLAKIVVGIVFCAGVIFSSIAGGEIFAGNSLMVVAVLTKKITIKKLLSNWAVVFIGNFIGGIGVALFISLSGQWDFSLGLLGATTIKTAVYKANMPFINAVILGVFCNLLICLAVWMSSATTTLTGKVSAIFFPISLFNICGFENSVANMYFIPAGIIASFDKDFCDIAISLGVSTTQIQSLGLMSLWQIFAVALGNIIGGGLFLGASYWLVHKSGLLD